MLRLEKVLAQPPPQLVAKVVHLHEAVEVVAVLAELCRRGVEGGDDSAERGDDVASV